MTLEGGKKKERDAEKRFKNIVGVSPDAILIIGSDGKVLFANKASCRLFARKKEELEGTEIGIPLSTNERVEIQLHPRGGGKAIGELLVVKTHWKGKKAFLALIRDITQRVQMEEKYKRLFNTSRDALMTLAPPTWKFTSGNPSAIELFGAKDEEDFISRSPWDYSPEKQPDGKSSKSKAKKMILKAVEDGSSFFEWTHKRLTGEVFPATVLLTRVEGETGGFVQATVRDITERKEAEEALKKSEEKWRLMFENMSTGLALHKIVCNSAGKPIDYEFLEVNPAFDKLTGLKGEDIVGKKATQAIPDIEKDPTDWIGRFGKVALTGEPITFESYSAPLDKWYTVTAYSPKEGHFVTLFDDITEKKKLNEAVKESESRFRSLWESSVDMYVYLDSQGKIVDVNKSALEAIGRKREDVIGKIGWKLDLFPSSDIPKLRKSFEDSLKGEIYPVYTKLKTKSGKLIDIECSDSVVIRDGEVTGMLITSRDITERKKMEDDLRRRGEFEALMAEISAQFIDISVEDIDGEITKSLELIGKFMDVDRAYLMQFSENLEMMDNTHEWCGEGIEPQIENLQNIEVEKEIPWFMEQIKQNSQLMLDVDSLGRVAKNFKKHLQEQGIKSLVGVPLVRDGKLIGYIGFDKVKNKRNWDDDTITLLHFSAHILLSALMRRWAEMDLRESNKELEESQRIAMLGRWHLDIVNDVLSWSPGIYNLFGLEPEKFEASYEAFLHAVHPDDRDRVNEAYTTSLKTKKPYDITHRIVRPDGEVRWVREICESVFDEKGEPLSSTGTVQDVTSMKLAEESLYEEQKNAQRYLELAGVMFIALDSEGKVTVANQKACDVLKCKKEEILGKDWFETFIPEEQREEVRKVFMQLMGGTTEGVEYYENEVLATDGTRKIVAWHNAYTKAEDGTVIGILGSGNDITERKQAERRFRALFEGAADAIFVADPKTRQLVDCNGEALRVTGFSKKEILSMKADELHPESVREKTMEGFRKQAEGRVKVVESELLTKDGTRIPVSISTSLVQFPEGKMLVGIFRDVTKQTELQEELRKRVGELEKMNKLMVGREVKMAEMKKQMKKYEDSGEEE